MNVGTKPSTATIIRTVVLILALINQALMIAGKSPLPFDNQDADSVVTFLITAGAALTAWWKNNSFTPLAISADETFKSGKEST